MNGPVKYTTKLYWYKGDQSPVEREHPSESAARGWAQKRSTEVAGSCSVLAYGAEIASYENGVDTLAAVAA